LGPRKDDVPKGECFFVPKTILGRNEINDEVLQLSMTDPTLFLCEGDEIASNLHSSSSSIETDSVLTPAIKLTNGSSSVHIIKESMTLTTSASADSVSSMPNNLATPNPSKATSSVISAGKNKKVETEKDSRLKSTDPAIDHNCSVVINEMYEAVHMERPRFDVSKFPLVWKCLQSRGWVFFDGKGPESAEEGYYRRRCDIGQEELTKGVNYFLTEEAVLEFVKDQIHARGGDFHSLVDLARSDAYGEELGTDFDIVDTFRKPKKSEEEEKDEEEETEEEKDEEEETEDEDEEEETEDEDEEVDYSQVIADHNALLAVAAAAAPDPALLLDENCSTEIREIVRSTCLDRPRLDMCSFPIVWNCLRGYDWNYFYGTGLGSEEVYHRPRTSIKSGNMHEFTEGVDYFLTKDAVLDFMKEQILARGGNYQLMADMATFFPLEDKKNDYKNLLDPVSDEDHINMRCPTDSLYQSSNPYETTFDALTTHDNYEEGDCEEKGGVEYFDDIPFDDIEDAEGSDCDEEDEEVEAANEVVEDIDVGDFPEPEDELQDEVETQNETQSQTQSQTTTAVVVAPAVAAVVTAPSLSQITGQKRKISPVKLLLDTTEPDSLAVVLARVKANLQPSHTPVAVLHRETELGDILGAVQQSLESGRGTAIRVAGQPGQGKTLTVKHALTALENDAVEAGSFSSHFMKGSEYSTDVKNQILDMISKCNRNSEAPMLVLVIDEIDMMPQPFQDTLLSSVKSSASRVVLIGLANKSSSATYNSEVVFEVYVESQLLDILKCLTENLLDHHGAVMLSKLAVADGDIRPMTTLALGCLEHVESELSASDTGAEDLQKHATSVVTMGVVLEVKKQSGTLDMRGKLESITKGALISVVALALQYSPGTIFRFNEVVALVNTHLDSMNLTNYSGDEVANCMQELVNVSLLHEVRLSQINRNSPNSAQYTMGVSAEDMLVDSCQKLLTVLNWNHLTNIVNIRVSEASL
jgi:hypothetical protein